MRHFGEGEGALGAGPRPQSRSGSSGEAAPGSPCFANARRECERGAAARLGFSRLPARDRDPDEAVEPQRSRYDAVVATSDKAFLSGAVRGAASPLYVVGARPARAAEARGWRLALPPAPDAAGSPKC